MANCHFTQAILSRLQALEGTCHAPVVLKLFWEGSVLYQAASLGHAAFIFTMVSRKKKSSHLHIRSNNFRFLYLPPAL